VLHLHNHCANYNCIYVYNNTRCNHINDEHNNNNNHGCNFNNNITY